MNMSKVPDKIYVLYDEDANFLSHTFTNVPCEYGGSKRDIAYIRTDALLEWARKSKLNTEHTNGIGWDDCLDELINHIELL